MPLPFTRQELKALVVIGATGLVGLSALLVTRLAPPGGDSPLRGPSPPPARINLNAASAEQLAALPGIGPATARRIVEDRQRHGRYLCVEDIARVKGISPKALPRLKTQAAIE